MKFKFILLLFSITQLACSNGGEADSSFKPKGATELSLVTGLEAKSSEFDSPLILGNPNVFYGQITFFPNPAIGFLSISSDAVISDVWFVKAKADTKYKNTDFSEILSSDLYTEMDISSISELSFSEVGGSNLTLNLENLDFGYYRVFVKIDNNIFWSNVYVGNDKEIDELINFWN